MTATPRDERAWLLWLRTLVGTELGHELTDADLSRPLRECGLSSRQTVAVAAAVARRAGRDLPPTLLWSAPTVTDLAKVLAEAAGPDEAVEARAAAFPPVAVVGLACRVPGAATAEAYWSLLLESRDAVGEVPAERWPQAGDDVPRQAGVLAGIASFDAEFFGVSPEEAALMDPQQRLLLEVAWEALAHAGIPPGRLRGTDTGVWVGLSATEYSLLTLADTARADAWSSQGAAGSIAANRLSYALGVHGPSMTIDTACSSSLVAVHQAVRALALQEADAALACGVNLLTTPGVSASFAAAGALAPDGRCKPFDAAADGIVRGEGCGVVVLKRLADARRAGDRVLAVIRGGAVNSDGRSNGLLAPNPLAQRRLLRQAYAAAGVPASTVDYVEAHGTGTLLGDPIEAAALSEALAADRPDDRPLLIGSVKSNIGHLEGAAGIAGLIKTVLALHHGRIPASRNHTEPNPHIDMSRLRVVTESTVWPRHSGQARAGVSAFGFGGTNAHLVLEEWPRSAPPPGQPHGRPAVIGLGAPTTERLARDARALADWLTERDVPPHRLAAALAHGRDHGVCRAAIVATDRSGVLAALRALAAGRPHALLDTARPSPALDEAPVFVFSGYGSQWPAMGARLLQEEPAFARAVSALDGHYADLAGFRLSEALGEHAGAQDFRVHQPALFGMQLALAELWRAHGVTPGAVIGHSIGEIAAAVVAGALSARDGLRVVLARTALLAEVDGAGAGAMAAVELSADGLAELREAFPSVTVAVHASPAQCTVSGPREQVAALVAHVGAGGGMARMLKVGGAGHSAAVDPLLGRFRADLGPVRPAPPTIPVYSTVTDDPRKEAAFDAAYWAANLRRPVRFTQAVAAALDDGHHSFVEVSAHPIATIAVEQTAAGREPAAQVLATVRRDPDGSTGGFAAAVARAHVLGHPGVLLARHPDRVVLDLPAPGWEHREYWVPPAPAGRPAGGHPLLGEGNELPEGDGHVWFGDVGLADHPWLADHAVDGVPVLPATAHLELVLAAGQSVLGPVGVRDLVLHRMLPLAERTRVCLRGRRTGTGLAVRVYGPVGDRHVLLADATAVPARRHTADATAVSARRRTADGTAVPARRRTADAFAVPDGGPVDAFAVSDGGPVDAFAVPGDHPADAFAVSDGGPVDVSAVPGDHPADAFAVSDGGPVDVSAVPGDHPADALVVPDGAPVDLYRRLDGVGQRYGPAFRALRSVTASAGTARADLAVPAHLRLRRFHLHPAQADACLHALAAAVDADEAARTAWLPVRFGGVHVSGDAAAGVRVRARLAPAGQGAVRRGDVQLLDARDQVVATFASVECAPLSAGDLPLGLDRLGHHAVWTPLPYDGPPRPTGPHGTQVLLDHGATWTAELADEITAHGGRAHVAPAHQAAAHAAGRDSVVLAIGGPSAPLDPRAARRLVASVADTVRALAELDAPPRLWLVTRGAVPITDDQPGHPGRAALRALVRVLAFEHPELRATLLDLDPAPDERSVAEAAAEILVSPPDDEVAWRGGVRYVRRLRSGTPPPRTPRTLRTSRTSRTPVVRPGSYLITGGLTGLGLATAEWLAERGATRLVLAGRRPPAPAAAGSIDRMRATGVEVAVVSGDIADARTADRMVAAGGADGIPVRGVIHAAGVLDDAAVVAMTDGQLDTVWRAKADGALRLHEATAALDLDWWVDYSSAAALLGSPGQAAYATANAWLDAFGAHRRARGVPVVTVHWGAWSGIGAAVAAAESAAARLGPVEGFAALGELLASGLSQVGVFRLDMNSVRDMFPDAVGRAYFAESAAPAPASARAAVGTTPEAITGHLLVVFGELLRADPSSLDPDAPLTALGLDSLTAMRARSTVERDIGVPLPLPLLLRGASTTELAAALAERLATGTTAVPRQRPGTDSAPGPEPRDTAERWVARHWRGVLGAHGRAVDVTLDTAGATDADRVRLAHEMNAALPGDDPVRLTGTDTIATVADLLRHRIEGGADGPVRVLADHGREAALFLFHPAGGPTAVYRPLADRIGGAANCYGLERLDAVDTVEAKAAAYIAEIRRLRPHGPYRLGGWSFGGCLAYEVARQLTAAGAEVDLLFLIDAILPLPTDDVDRARLTRVARFAEHVERTYGVPLGLDAPALGQGTDLDLFDQVVARIRERVPQLGQAALHHQYTSYLDARIAETYRPQPYGGPVLLFRAAEPHPLTTSLDPRYLRTDTALGWDALCPGLDVVPVPGDHISVIDPPHIDVVAHRLLKELESTTHVPGGHRG
ncbi:SDR family NAD(P)-dependent oxidoreductase [Streptomyces sp. NPDC003247]|uniref:SDR family NAD(P)-dependent oxidoreductase n=1 Tax=Streptomyces sp. NPDC003247 TaxID=3364677 RepID=UPI0036892BC9